MKSFIIEESEKSRILSMHKKNKLVVNEQVQDANLQKLYDALTKGCLPKDKGQLRQKPDPKDPTKKIYFFRGKSKSGRDIDFFADMTYKSTDNTINGIWKCNFGTPQNPTQTPETPQRPTQTPETPQTPAQLDKNQVFILNELGKLNWFREPVPTDVEIEQGLYTKIDLTGKNQELSGNTESAQLITTYGKYFKNFPEFYVYQKSVPKTKDIEVVEPRKVSLRNCKAAIENLLNNKNQPQSYKKITPRQIEDSKEVVRLCAEKRGLFFKLRIDNDKLQEVITHYGI